ncbi:MAG: hypothetical protein LQ338_007221 [Usnochroma carphineum]|nr:MAG: hypothetical protein LQ338_007221 [Usnochroma carphineum]
MDTKRKLCEDETAKFSEQRENLRSKETELHTTEVIVSHKKTESDSKEQYLAQRETQLKERLQKLKSKREELLNVTQEREKLLAEASTAIGSRHLREARKQSDDVLAEIMALEDRGSETQRFDASSGEDVGGMEFEFAEPEETTDTSVGTDSDPSHLGQVDS